MKQAEQLSLYVEPMSLPAQTQGTISLKPTNDMNHKMKPTQKQPPQGHCSGLTIAIKADVEKAHVNQRANSSNDPNLTACSSIYIMLKCTKYRKDVNIKSVRRKYWVCMCVYDKYRNV